MTPVRQRLLLLNPPAPSPVFRDCYCSGHTKGRLAAHPLDLQMQSGFFSDGEFRLEFIDAIQEGLSVRGALDRIGSFAPDAILTLVGDVVLAHDAAFLEQIKAALPGCRIFASGDIARFRPREALERVAALDGILADLSSAALLAHLRQGGATGLWLRGGRVPEPPPLAGSYQHPLPRADVIRRYRRRLPFFRVPEYYSLATSYGCPYGCLYCSTHCLGYRTRPIEDVIEELYHAAELGYRSLYIRDATFLYDRTRSLLVLQAWQRTGLRFEWICFTRPDLIDDEVATAAATLGCRLVMLGVESFDEDCLTGMARHLPIETTRQAVRILRKHGIPAAAQLIAGLRRLDPRGAPSGLAEYEAALEGFLSTLDPDYVSFSVYHPRPGVPPDSAVLASLAGDRAACERLARRVTRRFYTRPRTILRRLAGIQSLAQLSFQARTAADLFFPARGHAPAEGRGVCRSRA